MAKLVNMINQFRQFWLALSFLSRIPVCKSLDFSGLTLAQAAWAFPLIGMLIGALTGGVLLAALNLGITATLAGWVAVGFAILITGGLHEDGLADMADGLAHGRSQEQKLTIMRDSRIGSYGVMALVIILALRASALAAFSRPYNIMLALIAAAALSRACMAIMMYRLPLAKEDGLAANAGKPTYLCAKMAFLLGIVPLFFLPLQVMGVCLLTVCIICFAIKKIAITHFGGITGDVLGATQQISETALLILLSAHLA